MVLIKTDILAGLQLILNQSSLISVECRSVSCHIRNASQYLLFCRFVGTHCHEIETSLYPSIYRLRACYPVCQFIVNMTPLQNRMNQNFCTHCAVPKDQDDRYPIENIKHTKRLLSIATLIIRITSLKTIVHIHLVQHRIAILSLLLGRKPCISFLFSRSSFLACRWIFSR